MFFLSALKNSLRFLFVLFVLLLVLFENESYAAAKPLIIDANNPEITRPRLEKNVDQVIQAMIFLGQPLSEEESNQLKTAKQLPDYEAIGKIQDILDKHTLVTVHIDDEAWFKITPASMDPKTRYLTQNHWHNFLVKVDNEGRVTSPLEVKSPQSIISLHSVEKDFSSSTCQPDTQHDWSKWFRLRLFKQPPMQINLSGKEIEYFILQICSLDSGLRAGELVFYLGGGQVSQGHFGDANLIFLVAPDSSVINLAGTLRTE